MAATYPASQLRSETRTIDSYAGTGSVAVSRDCGTNGRPMRCSIAK